MEYIGLKFKSGFMQVSLDPDSKKINIIANINGTDVTGNMTLKPVKSAKESK